MGVRGKGQLSLSETVSLLRRRFQPLTQVGVAERASFLKCFVFISKLFLTSLAVNELPGKIKGGWPGWQQRVHSEATGAGGDGPKAGACGKL